MTTYLDYKTLPAENNGPPPVGAPEQMPTSQVNNVMREIMSVIRQLGDQFQAGFDGLGTMSLQDADAVEITGGTVTATLNGPGGGITNLKAQNLIEGPIPSTIFPPDATPLNAKVARAGAADSLTSTYAILPIGTILMWYSNATPPAGWWYCDGADGRPNLQARFPIGAGAGVGLGQMGGQLSYNAVTDAQGAHSHGGVVGGHALTIPEMPAHVHTETAYSGGGGTYSGPAWNGGVGNAGTVGNVTTMDTGGNQAHNHAIGADGSHQHNVTVNSTPAYTAIWFIIRIS